MVWMMTGSVLLLLSLQFYFPLLHTMTAWSSLQLHDYAIIYIIFLYSLLFHHLPVLSLILTTDVSLPLLTWGVLLITVKLISNLSVLSTILSHNTGISIVCTTSLAANVALVGLESKSTPDPIFKYDNY